jgi:hypothetical protein
MSKPNDNPISYLTALKHLRDRERQQGIEPLQRGEDCLSPTELALVALGRATPECAARAQKHLEGCVYCKAALAAMRSMVNDEPLPDLPDDGEDPTGRWVMSGEPLTPRPAPDPVPAPVVSADTRTAAKTSLGFTQMATNPQLWPRLIEELRPCVRPLLCWAGLDAAWADEFLAYVESRLPTLGDRRFTPMLDQWCEEFARTRNATPTRRIATATLRSLEPLATSTVLEEQQPGEPERVARLRKAALAREELTRAELLNLSLPEEGDAPWIEQQLREWYFHSGTQLQRLRELFEVA